MVRCFTHLSTSRIKDPSYTLPRPWFAERLEVWVLYVRPAREGSDHFYDLSSSLFPSLHLMTSIKPTKALNATFCVRFSIGGSEAWVQEPVASILRKVTPMLLFRRSLSRLPRLCHQLPSFNRLTCICFCSHARNTGGENEATVVCRTKRTSVKAISAAIYISFSLRSSCSLYPRLFAFIQRYLIKLISSQHQILQ